jgi:hypothetical protein
MVELLLALVETRMISPLGCENINAISDFIELGRATV